MTLNEFLNEFLDPKFQESMKQTEQVLVENGTIDMVLAWKEKGQNKNEVA